MTVKLTITLRKGLVPTDALPALLGPRQKVSSSAKRRYRYERPMPYISDRVGLAALRKLDAAGLVEWKTGEENGL